MIAQEVEEVFGEKVGDASMPRFVKYFAAYYADTEQALVQSMLRSPHIHADETTISIKGVDYYVWVTDGPCRVQFEERKAKITSYCSYSGGLLDFSAAL
jgi:hypothetical protein